VDTRSGEVTRLLRDLQNGDAAAQAKLIPLVYQELRRLAARHMRGERPGHTLQATALVHEAFLRLTEQNADWQNKAHFFAVASQVMRHILIDHARGRVRVKRGGGQQRILLDEALLLTDTFSEELLALDEALERLAKLDPRQARIVELRFFGGLSVEEAAEVAGISPKTVKRDWSLAKAWLYQELRALHGNDAGAVGEGQGPF
jgi:RNA polymerase sigma-70 factor (ECF subfamily)